MDNCEGGVVSSDARQARLLPEHRDAVGRACQAAATTLEAFSRVLIEAMSSDASIESIDQRLKMKLAMVWREKSATIEDLRDKCRLLRRLGDVFPPGDWQVQIFSYNLAHEMADFLET